MSSTLEPALLEPQVLALAERYRYEELHCRRVAALAAQLFVMLHPLHELGEAEATLLRHAALLHDIGHFVHYRKHHKHSAYLIEHDAALAGYPEPERQMLALIARNHRKEPKVLPSALGSARVRTTAVLSAILRLADGLDAERTGRAAIRGCQIERREVVLEIEGVNLEGEAENLNAKATMIKSVFGRTLVWRRYDGAAVAEDAEAAGSESEAE